MAKSKNELQVSTKVAPQSLTIAAKGIATGNDFAGFMSALMSDLIDGRVSLNVGKAACNAGDQLLRVVEMQMMHGTRSGTNGGKVLTLAIGEPSQPQPTEE